MKEEREDSDVPEQTVGTVASADDSTLADQLAQELQCGCCSELVYRPVIVAPCQHFFCGR
jgi:E3 ubiquitin-protein ligase CHFR